MLDCAALPGHRKQTNDTRINCDSGEAYQGRVIGPSFKLLYFHPPGISTSLCSTQVAGNCVLLDVEPILDEAMEYERCVTAC
jgi:hypothetical protein